LTEAQRLEVQRIVADAQPEVRHARLAVLKAQEALRQAVTNNPDDAQAIGSAGQALGSALAAQEVQRAKLEAKVEALLTPDQKAELAQRRAAARARVQALIDRLSQAPER
jgi:periplasmic protein CpxP/Spy